ncbi:MAG TPA: hypothetical protein PLB38_00045 [bacterium]|nr:hypothetical protein [bacterium]
MDFKKAYLFKVIPAFNDNPAVKICLEQYEKAEEISEEQVHFSKESWRIFRASWQIKWFLEGEDWPEKNKYLPQLEAAFKMWLEKQKDFQPESEESLRCAFYRWKISDVLVEELGHKVLDACIQEFANAISSAKCK